MAESDSELPPCVIRLLHDCEAGTVSWVRHRDFLIDRILSRGDWDAITWLRRMAGDEVVRDRIARTHGRALSPRQLRFWQVVLDLPEDEVSAWLRAPARSIWDRRSA